jgi:hypothetical protein
MGTTLSLRFGVATIAAIIALLSLPASASPMTCAGPDPAVVAVNVARMQSDGKLNRYTLKAKIVNLGQVSQASNTLQFVDIYKGSTKLDSRGIPPLRAGQTFTFSYISMRSAQAGSKTTVLSFRMDERRPSLAGAQDCNTGNGITIVRF